MKFFVWLWTFSSIDETHVEQQIKKQSCLWKLENMWKFHEIILTVSLIIDGKDEFQKYSNL